MATPAAATAATPPAADTAARRDRAAGAVMGALIGDALGVGPHWYYDLEELRREFGWITGYTQSKPGRYHEALSPGDLSQTGAVAELLLRSVAERGRYDAADFCSRLDDLLATLDGTPYCRGDYTDVAMRDLWRGRQTEKLEWGDERLGSWCDTSEGAIRAVVLAARYAGSLGDVAGQAMANVRLTHLDPVVAGQSMSFALLVAAMIQGEALDGSVCSRLRELAKSQQIPITHAVLAEEREAFAGKPLPADPTPTVPFPDALLQVGWVVEAARDPEIRVPPHKVGQVYGLACSIHFLLPAAYFLAATFEGEPGEKRFEQAVLAAVNSGGNNMARAALTGALVGSIVGLSAIPRRFIDGLTKGQELEALALRLAEQAFPPEA